MKLYHGAVLLGEIGNISQEGSWMYGELVKTPAASQYEDFFAWMTDEEKQSEDPPFSDDYLNPDNWSIEDETGKRRGIEVPAVHDDGSIEWRWS